MCFPFDAWCCFGPGPGHKDDYCCSSVKGGSLPPHHSAVPPKTTTVYHPPLPPPAQRNGHYHEGLVAHHANGHKAPHHTHQQQLLVAEARRGHAAATKGADGYPAGAQYVYSGADGLLKHPAANTRIIADGAHYYYQECEPAHKEEYYHTTDHERY